MNDELIVETVSERRYFLIIPNMIDDLRLSPYAFRLYAHFKRVAGETGSCWQSRYTLAQACNMSLGMVTKCRKELVEAGLIDVASSKNPHGGKDFLTITIRDIWGINNHFYSMSPSDLATSHDDIARSLGDIKKNPIKNKSQKQKNDADASYLTPSANDKDHHSPSAHTELQFLFLTYLDILFNGRELKPSLRDTLFKSFKRLEHGTYKRDGLDYECSYLQLIEALEYHMKHDYPEGEITRGMIQHIINSAWQWRVNYPRDTIQDAIVRAS